jgi:hypothetical protein
MAPSPGVPRSSRSTTLPRKIRQPPGEFWEDLLPANGRRVGRDLSERRCLAAADIDRLAKALGLATDGTLPRIGCAHDPVREELRFEEGIAH